MVKLLRPVLLLFLLFSYSTSFAQRIQIDIPSLAEVGEPFSVSYVYRGTGNLEQVQEPKHAGLRLIYGPARDQSSQMTIINGKTSSSSSVTITYTFLAEKTGTYVISPTVATVDGKQTTIPGGRVQVAPATNSQGQGGNSAHTRGAGAPPQFHYVTLPSARSVYEQQALPVRFRFYASSNFDLKALDPPQLDGFVSEEVPDGGKKQLFIDKYQGRDYRAVDLQTLVLFPQRSGTLTITPAKVSVLVPEMNQLRGDDIDALFGFTPSVEQVFASPSTSITVRPLPSEGKPADFSGAVGSFSLQAQLLTKTPRTNESVTIRLTLQGAGNLKTAISPKVSFPETFEVYDPKETYESTVTASNVQGKKVIEYFAIPQHTGSVTIPPITFSYFDPQQGRYITLRSQSFAFQVAQGKAISRDEHKSLRSAEERMKTLQPEDERTYPSGWTVAGSWSYLLLFPLLLLGALGVYLYYVRDLRLKADTLGYQASKASKVVTRRLRTAKQHLDRGDRDALYEELLRALWGYLGDKLRLPTAELSRSSVSEHLRHKGIPDEDITLLTEVVDEVEFARYAPAHEGDLQLHYDRVAEVISRIDRHRL